MSDETDRYGSLVEGTGLSVERSAGDTAWCYGGAPVTAVGACDARGSVRVLDLDATLWEFDADTGEVRSRTRLAGVRSAFSAAFDTAGERLAAATYRGPTAVYDAATGAVRAPLALALTTDRAEGSPRTVLHGFSSDGAHVLASYASAQALSFGEAGVRDARSGALVTRWSTRSVPAWNARDEVVFLAGGGSEDETLDCVTRAGEVRWRTRVEVRGPVVLVMSGDGATVFVTGTVATGAEPRAPAGVLGPVRFRLAALDALDGRALWSREGGQPFRVHPVPGSARVLLEGAPTALDATTGAPLAPSPDERSVFLHGVGEVRAALSRARGVHYVAHGGLLRRLDASTRRERVSPGPALGELVHVALAPSGARALTAARSRELRVWDVRAGATEWALEGVNRKHDVDAVALAADERFAMAVNAERALFWSLATGLSAFEVPFAAPANRARAGTGVGLSRVSAWLLLGDAQTLLLVGTPARPRTARELLAYDLGAQRVRWRVRLEGPLFSHRVALAAQGEVLHVAAWDRENAAVGAFALDGSGPLGPARALRYPPADLPERGLAPYGSAGAWAIDGGRLVATQDGPSASYACPGDEATSAAYPLARSDDGRWVCTGSQGGDALLWRVRAGSPGEPPFATCTARVRLGDTHDALSCAAFDARGETLALGTARGALLCCAIAR